MNEMIEIFGRSILFSWMILFEFRMLNNFNIPGFESVVFASLVPKSANKLLQQVVEEIIGDHEMMVCFSLLCQ